MSQGLLTIEVTNSKIRYVYCDRKGKGVTAHKAGAVPFVLNISAKGELARALQEIIKREGLSPQRIFAILSRQENFIRQLQMPKMTAHELQEAITAEIEKLPQFNNRTFDYIHHVSTIAKEKTNVVFAAIEQAMLTYLMSEVQKLNIPFEHIEISPLNMKEMISLVQSGHDNQVILTLTEHTANLAIFQGRQYKLLYQSGIGTEQLFPHHNDTINQPVMFNLLGELQRVLKSYLSQHKTEQLKKLWLIWDHSGAAGLQEALTGQLGLDVETLNLERIPGISAKGDNVQNPIYVMTALPVILYLKKIKESFPLNHFFRAQHLKRYCVKVIVIGLVVAGIMTGTLGARAWDYRQQQTTVQNEIAAINQEKDNLKNATKELYRQRDEFMATRQGLLQQATYVRMLNRVSWSQVLSVAAEEMPEKMALTSFKFSESGSVSFFGETLDVETVAELIRRVDTSTIVEKGKFDFLSEKMVEDQKIFSFGILANLKKTEDALSGPTNE